MTEEPLEAAVQSLSVEVARVVEFAESEYIPKKDANRIFDALNAGARRQRIQTFALLLVIIGFAVYGLYQRHHDQEVLTARREAATTARMNQCLASDHTNEAFRLWVNFLIQTSANSTPSTPRDPEVFAQTLKRFREFTEQSFPPYDCPAIVRGDPIPPLPPLPQLPT